MVVVMMMNTMRMRIIMKSKTNRRQTKVLGFVGQPGLKHQQFATLHNPFVHDIPIDVFADIGVIVIVVERMQAPVLPTAQLHRESKSETEWR